MAAVDLDSMDAIELRAALEAATNEALKLADDLIENPYSPFEAPGAADRIADYRYARLTMRRLRRALLLEVGGRG